MIRGLYGVQERLYTSEQAIEVDVEIIPFGAYLPDSLDKSQ